MHWNVFCNMLLTKSQVCLGSNLVKTDPGNGLLPDGTKPSHWPILIRIGDSLLFNCYINSLNEAWFLLLEPILNQDCYILFYFLLQGDTIGKIIQKKNINHYEASGNLALALNALQKDGVRLVNIGKCCCSCSENKTESLWCQICRCWRHWLLSS